MSKLTYDMGVKYKTVWWFLAGQVKDESTKKHKNQNQFYETANLYYINRSEKVTTTRFIQLTKRNIKMHLSRQERLRQLHQWIYRANPSHNLFSHQEYAYVYSPKLVGNNGSSKS